MALVDELARVIAIGGSSRIGRQSALLAPASAGVPKSGKFHMSLANSPGSSDKISVPDPRAYTAMGSCSKDCTCKNWHIFALTCGGVDEEKAVSAVWSDRTEGSIRSVNSCVTSPSGTKRNHVLCSAGHNGELWVAFRAANMRKMNCELTAPATSMLKSQ